MTFSDWDDLHCSTDEQLLAISAAGNERALAVLMQRHSSWIFRIAYHVIRDKGEARDIVQEVFRALYQTADRFDLAKGNFMSWTLRITRNKALKRRRYLEVRGFYSNISLGDLEEPAASERVVSGCRLAEQEESLLLQEALAVLGPAQRMAVNLRVFEGLPADGVARKTGKSIHVVENNLSRALKKLRKLFSKNGSVDSAG